MYVEIKHTAPWTDYTLIMPVVSVGNVGQLAIDLLISTLKPRKVGYFYDAAFWPIIGSDPYTPAGQTSGEIVTSCEVYELKESKVVLVQQRVPIIKYRRLEFRRKLIAWIRKNKFGNVVLLSSCNSTSRIDSQLDGSSLRFLCTPAVDEITNAHLTKKLQWKRLERRISLPTPSGAQLVDPAMMAPSKTPLDVYIPGGGLTKKIFLECLKEDIPLVVLMVFCSEGDNIPDSLAMASHLNEWLKIVRLANADEHREGVKWKAWQVPPSWQLLFGKRAPTTIYW